jgi:hypothetical protein
VDAGPGAYRNVDPDSIGAKLLRKQRKGVSWGSAPADDHVCVDSVSHRTYHQFNKRPGPGAYSFATPGTFDALAAGAGPKCASPPRPTLRLTL